MLIRITLFLYHEINFPFDLINEIVFLRSAKP